MMLLSEASLKWEEIPLLCLQLVKHIIFWFVFLRLECTIRIYAAGQCVSASKLNSFSWFTLQTIIIIQYRKYHKTPLLLRVLN